MMFALPRYTSITSSAMGVVVGAGFLYWVADNFKVSSKTALYLCLFGGMFLLGVISMLYTNNYKEGSHKVFLKLPMLLVAFCIPLVREFSLKRVYTILFLFILLIFGNGLISMINYLANYHEINEMILQSKPVPILGKIYHIQYSVLCACSIFIGIHMYKNTAFETKALNVAILVFTIGNFIFLHVLSARTGLLAFYLTAFIISTYYIIKGRKKWALGAILAMLALPVVAYYTVGSFKNRVENTKSDLKIILDDANPNYHSNAQRMEALRASWTLLVKNPLGVGIGDVKHEMHHEYELRESRLEFKHEKKPHNQFLELALQSGLVTGVLLIILLAFPFLKFRKKLTYLFASFLMVYFISFNFESLLERQSGLYLFLLLFVLIERIQSHNTLQNNNKESLV
jgi:O-antigen ligase